MLGTIAKAVNKKASGYGLFLTTAARDGGLREDSLGLLACLVHSRTSQKYDKKILAGLHTLESIMIVLFMDFQGWREFLL